MRRHLGLALLVLCLALMHEGRVRAQSVTVNAADDIYYADQSSDPTGGNVPTAVISLGGASAVDFTSVTGSLTCGVSGNGCITLNGFGNLNDADGNGAAVSSSSNTGANGISGITAPGAGYLVGVFLPSGGPSGPAPSDLDFTTGDGTSFTSLSPALDQTFFVGDGQTGDGSGTTQTFDVPSGAATLVLGISDACGYNGSPSCWTDNSGTFTVDYSSVGAVPEPATLVLLGTALVGFGAVRRRRK